MVDVAQYGDETRRIAAPGNKGFENRLRTGLEVSGDLLRWGVGVGLGTEVQQHSGCGAAHWRFGVGESGAEIGETSVGPDALGHDSSFHHRDTETQRGLACGFLARG